MHALIIVIYAVTLCVCLGACLRELQRDLTMLQQNSYRADRYRRWLRASGDTTSIPRLMGIIVLGLLFVRFVPPGTGVMCAFLFGAVVWARLAGAKWKKPLVWTARARRIYGCACALAALVLLVTALPGIAGISAVALLFRLIVASVAMYVLSHPLILAAAWLLQPVEKRINKGYYDDAARILASMPDLKVVGVTGSYGKTSTKHYLQRILSEKYDTAMTPGNFNTTLGVIRTVREHLKPYNEVFIVEMGAKQPGDIKEICDLVHPTIAIVTAVGPQHLESFGSIDNVQATKFELVDSLPADGGFAVVNNDFEKVADRPVTSTECARYAVSHDCPDVRYTARDVRYTPRGATFTFVDKATGLQLPVETRLVGECNISNLVAAIAVALHLGVEPRRIAYAVAHIEQVEHRLNVKRIPGGITIIDDAYNSNPAGSSMALDVLAGMKEGKRIVITPGMVELGDEQEELNRAFGARIARCADVAIIVAQVNRDAIREGIESAGNSALRTHYADSFAEAQAMLGTIASPGDTVLYENDLPDTFK